MNQPINPTGAGKVNRRTFLKSSSTAVAGGALLGALPVERFALGASPGDTLRLALIGCGGRGSQAANQALSTSGGVKLVAMADVFKDQLEGSLNNLKKTQKEKVEVNEDTMFIGFDAYKHAIEHVFMEKPVATDAPGVRRVLAAAEEAKKKNLKVAVGLQRHHHLAYLETLARLHDGAIGDIVAMRCYWNGNTPWVKFRADLEKKYGRPLTEMEYQMRNWYYFVWLCGDHICEQHIHNLDVINWVKKGYPVRAHGMGGCEVRKGKDYGEIFDHHAVEFEYADGSRCFSQCRHINGCWSNVSEHMIGTKGTCDVGGHVIRGENAWRFRKEGAKDPYQQEHDDLFAAIRNDTPYSEAENGAKSTMTSILGRMATYSGKVIEWEKAIESQLDYFPKTLAWDAEPPVKPNADGMYQLPVPGKTITV